MIRRSRKRADAPGEGTAVPAPVSSAGYDGLLGGIAALLEEARRTSIRVVNALMTAGYWEIGRRIVEYEQGGKARAEYGVGLLERLSTDLCTRFGRGFSVDNLQRFRLFYLAWPPQEIYATASRKLDTARQQRSGRRPA